MAVIKAKPQRIVDFYLETLRQGLISPLVVTRANSKDFKNTFGDTVTLRINGLRAVAHDYEFRTRNQPIEFDDIQGEDGIDVKLDTHVTSATLLTDEHYTLDDINFGEEVVSPQVEAVVGKFESKVVAGLRNADARHSIAFSPSDDPHLVALEAKRRMDGDKVAPNAGRVFLVGSDMAAAMLASDRLSKYESTGQSGTPALRDAVIGKLANSPVVVVPEMNPEEGYYLHKTGLVLANIAPDVPPSIKAGRTGISQDGFSVRWISDYDSLYVRDRSIVSSFLGVNDVRDQRDEKGDLVAEEERHNVRIIPMTISGTGEVFSGVTTQS